VVPFLPTITGVLLCLATLGRGAERDEGSWPLFRGDAGQTGVATSALPEKLALRWTHEAGDGVSSTAAIVGGLAYVGTAAGKLLALDLATGKAKWAYAAQAEIEGAPAVRDGRVFVGDGEGIFHCVDAATGKKLWSFATEAQIISSANFAGRRVLVGSYDNFLYCLDAASGKLAWKFETAAQVHCSPCIAHGPAGGTAARGIYAAIAGCDGALRLIAVDTGKQQAEVKLEDNAAASPAFDGKRIYVPTLGGRVFCVEAASSKVVWQQSVADASFFASPAVAGDRVLVGGRDRMVRCLAAADGKPLWRYKTRGKVDSSPVVVGDRVFFGSDDGRLYAVALATGKLVWSFPAGSPITASPAVGAGCLVIGTDDGAIYCFGARHKGGTRKP